jgi:lantibiotic biosynthesis dehydratase-like protein
VTEWHTARIHHHAAEGRDDLVLDAVRPLFATLARLPGRPRAYWTRHWLRGPHIRVNVRTTPRQWRDEVVPLVEDVVRSWLRDHPSAGEPDQEGQLRVHRRLAELEQEAGPVAPWFPDNSVQYVPYDARLHVLRTVESAELLADFHVDTTELAFAATAAVRAGTSRLEVPLRLMFATTVRGCPPLEKGYLSYRSHAEGFLANCSDPPGLRRQFELAYRKNREAMRQRMDDVVSAVGAGAVAPPLADWLPVLDTYLRRAGELNDANLLELGRIEAPGEVAGPAGQQISPFHRALFGDERIRDELNNAGWFAVYRVLLNYQYLLFNRLGLVPVERFLLCYLVARTVEEAYDLTIPEFLDPAATATGTTAAGPG